MKIKVLLLITALVGVFSSCKDDDDSKFKGNDAPIYINGRDRANKATSDKLETVHEILTKHIIFMNRDAGRNETGGVSFSADGGKSRGWEDNLIDTINDRLVMEAMNVIANERLSPYGGTFLMSRNFILMDYATFDTLGYIPNSVIREAQKDILDMWKAGDISAIYERFQQAFYFTPCTAEEFKAIKEDIDWEHEYDDLKAEHEHTHEIRW